MSTASDPLPPEPGWKVLYIEDHPVNMALVESILEAYPLIRFLKASTGREGVRLAQSETPDVVLLDMRLPDIGGLEVVRALSEQISRQRLRVVLLTADSFSIDVVKAMSRGATAYWRKPLTVDAAVGGLRRLLGDRPFEDGPLA